MIFIILLVTVGFVSCEQPQFEGYNYDLPAIPFKLPARQQLPPREYIPQTNYGPPGYPDPYQPQNTYRPSQPENNFAQPQNKYGNPSIDLDPPLLFRIPEGRRGGDPEGKGEDPENKGEDPERKNDVETTEVPTTTETATEREAEQLRDVEDLEETKNDEQGAYYIYHPNGVLQKVVFSTKNDLKNMAYSAQFKYNDVEPIRDPVYTYDPETLLLRQIVA